MTVGIPQLRVRIRCGLSRLAVRGHHVRSRPGDDDFMAVKLDMKVHEESLSQTKGRRPWGPTPLRLLGPAPGGAGLKPSGAYFVAAVSAASPEPASCPHAGGAGGLCLHGVIMQWDHGPISCVRGHQCKQPLVVIDTAGDTLLAALSAISGQTKKRQCRAALRGGCGGASRYAACVREKGEAGGTDPNLSPVPLGGNLGWQGNPSHHLPKSHFP